MATTHGALLAYGGVSLEGSPASLSLDGPIIGVAATPDGKGYFLAATDGAVFTYGDATFYGSMGGNHLDQPITGIATTPDGHGYWLVAADGGVFTYGDATFYGSMGGVHLDAPVQGIASTPDGHGYWEVASDGGIFTYGDATFYGSMGNKFLAAPIVGITPTPNAKGYWEVAQDGGVFCFGDAQFYGSASQNTLNAPIVGMGATPDGRGYWEAGSDGGTFAYGDAPYRGSDGSVHDLFYPVVAFSVAKGSGTGVDNGISEGLDRYDSGAEGYDISWPQCGGSYPPPAAVAVVGINNGHGMSTNPCFSSEAAWAGVNLSIYMNADFFDASGTPPPSAMNGPAGACSASDLVCQGYNYGWGSAEYSLAAVQSSGYSSDLWWLDVETANDWSGSTEANASAIQGMIDYLTSQGLVVGVYSTSYQWSVIAGSYAPAVPNWYATGQAGDPPFGCDQGFTGGPTWLVQAQWTGSDASEDGDYTC